MHPSPAPGQCRRARARRQDAGAAKIQQRLPQASWPRRVAEKTSMRPWISVIGLGIDSARRYGGALPAERRCNGCHDTNPRPASGRRTQRTKDMADRIVPHFHNTPGVAVIEIGAKEFMCEGELAPFDHPHVFLDMGDANEIICPYCSTLFRHDPALDPHAARPAECALPESATA
jgi:uncharacterized Zn-finger protein